MLHSKGKRNILSIKTLFNTQIPTYGRNFTFRSPFQVPFPILFLFRKLLVLDLWTRNVVRSLGTSHVLARPYNTYPYDRHVEILSSVAEIEHYEVCYELNGAKMVTNIVICFIFIERSFSLHVLELDLRWVLGN